MDIIRFNSHLNEVQMKVKKKNNNFYNQNNLDNENQSNNKSKYKQIHNFNILKKITFIFL